MHQTSNQPVTSVSFTYRFSDVSHVRAALLIIQDILNYERRKVVGGDSTNMLFI